MDHSLYRIQLSLWPLLLVVAEVEEAEAIKAEAGVHGTKLKWCQPS